LNYRNINALLMVSNSLPDCLNCMVGASKV